MGIVDDSPQIKVIRVDLVDLGNSNTKFSRSYIYDEDGSFVSFDDTDINGNPYTATLSVEKEGSGTTTLNLGDLETVTTLVDNLDGTFTYTNEDGTQVTITSGGGGSSDHGTLSGLEDDDHPQYKARSFHTGTQLAATISDFSTAVRAVILTGLSTATTAAVTATDTVLSSIGKLQARTALLFYGESARNETGLINNTTTEEDFLILNATTPVAGEYKIDWAATWSGNDGAQDNIIRLYADGVVMWTNIQEPKDTAGTGIVLPDTTGGTSNSGTNQRHNFSMFDIISLSAGAVEIKITIDSSANNDLQAIYKGVVSIRKWGLN